MRSVRCATRAFADFELIIVDDGGNDASMDIVQSFEAPRSASTRFPSSAASHPCRPV